VRIFNPLSFALQMLIFVACKLQIRTNKISPNKEQFFVSFCVMSKNIIIFAFETLEQIL